MVISSLILKCTIGAERDLIHLLKRVKGLSVEANLEGQLVLALESPTLEAAHHTMDRELGQLPGVLGVYPVYIHCEEEVAS